MSASAVLLAASAALRFAWPEHAEAQVELTDERAVGDLSRKVVITYRLRVDAIRPGDRLLIRLSDATLRSVNGSSPSEADPADDLLATARVLEAATPSIIVSRNGGFVGVAASDRLVDDMLAAAGLPQGTPGSRPLAAMLGELARDDWMVWSGAWVGASSPEPDTAGFVKLESVESAESDAVRTATRGSLVDLARKAKELGDDPAAAARFLEGASYSPMTVTLRAELDPGTMQPRFAERLGTFYAAKGKHRVDGRERRTHRFTWIALTSTP